MKAGDKVRILDHSYTVTLDPKGALTHPIAYGGFYKDDKLIIIATNIDFPGDNIYSISVERNNTLVFSITHQQYFFIQERFLKPIDRYCSKCGQLIR